MFRRINAVDEQISVNRTGVEKRLVVVKLSSEAN